MSFHKKAAHTKGFSFPDLLSRGRESAKRELREAKARSLVSMVGNDLCALGQSLPLLLSPSEAAREKGREAGVTRLGRLRYELYHLKVLARHFLCWLSVRYDHPRVLKGESAPAGSNSAQTYVYSFARHRIGDKVVVSALFQYLRIRKPGCRIIAVDDSCYLDRRTQQIPSDTLFGGLVNEVWNIEGPEDCSAIDQLIGERGFIRLAFSQDLAPIPLLGEEGCCENSGAGHCYGNPWLMLPALAKQGIYPRIALGQVELPETLDDLDRRIEGRKVLVLHILEDAPYNTERNHRFEQMEALCRTVLEKTGDAFVVRVGQPSTRLLSLPEDSCLDATRLGLTVLQSARLIQMADVYVGGDTGMTHMAGALNVPHIFAIYGYGYGLEFTLRHCFPCVQKSKIAERVSTFPSVPPSRITKFVMKCNSFDVLQVSAAVIKKLRQ